MYNKLFTKILDSSIWLEPTTTRIVWMTLLASMDEDGFAQFASLANLSYRARVSDKEAEEAVQILESPDINSSDPSHEGKRIERVPGGWMVLNAEKYRDLVTRIEIKKQNRVRVQRFREKQANVTQCNASPLHVTECNGSVMQSDTDTDTDTKKILCKAEEEILAYLNEKTGKKFQPVNGSLKFISSRLKEGATIIQCKGVIDLKCKQWLGDSKMKDYLRPQTLFNAEKFAAYVGEIDNKPIEKKWI